MNPEVLRKMRFNPSGHNSIYTDHLETITDTLEEICPIEAKKCISILGASVGMSDRFVKEHIRRLEACDVIRKVKGEYIWNIGVKETPKSILLEGMKNEDVLDTFPRTIGEIKEEYPLCKERVGGECVHFEGNPFLPSQHRCVACKTRQEA